MTDLELQGLEILLMTHPGAGPVIAGTGGLRKLRFASTRSGKGKRGGLRICYAYFEEFSLIHLVVVYGKTEKDDLSDKARAAIKKYLEETRQALRQRFSPD